MNKTNVSLKDAEKILLGQGMVLLSVVEITEGFIFSTAPQSTPEKIRKQLIRPLLMVCRDTGDVKIFNPITDNTPEYLQAIKTSIKYY